MCSSSCTRDGRSVHPIQCENSLKERAVLMLLYFIFSYFSSASPVSLGHSDIRAFSLGRFPESRWCQSSCSAHTPGFPCAVGIPGNKKCSWVFCVPLSIQWQFRFDNKYSVFNSWLEFGVAEWVPYWTAGSFAKSKDFVKGSSLRVSPVLSVAFRFQWC